MPESQASLERFGREIAAAQGHDPNDPGIDYAAYGRAASHDISRQRGVESPERFRVVPRPPPAESTYLRRGAETEPSHTVRIGAYEFSGRRIQAERAGHRLQHASRRGERTSGRYRRRGRWLRERDRAARRRGVR